jgi:hypothetical protein
VGGFENRDLLLDLFQDGGTPTKCKTVINKAVEAHNVDLLG